MNSQLKPKDIVRSALSKSGLSQQKFAKQIKKSQPMLSKYISGLAVPPADVIILCMNKSGLLKSTEVSAKSLATRVNSELDGEQNLQARIAFSQLLDSITAHNVSDIPLSGGALR